MKRPALQNKQAFYEWLFGPEKLSGLSRKRLLVFNKDTNSTVDVTEDAIHKLQFAAPVQVAGAFTCVDTENQALCLWKTLSCLSIRFQLILQKRQNRTNKLET